MLDCHLVQGVCGHLPNDPGGGGVGGNNGWMDIRHFPMFYLHNLELRLCTLPTQFVFGQMFLLVTGYVYWDGL